MRGGPVVVAISMALVSVAWFSRDALFSEVEVEPGAVRQSLLDVDGPTTHRGSGGLMWGKRPQEAPAPLRLRDKVALIERLAMKPKQRVKAPPTDIDGPTHVVWHGEKTPSLIVSTEATVKKGHVHLSEALKHLPIKELTPAEKMRRISSLESSRSKIEKTSQLLHMASKKAKEQMKSKALKMMLLPLKRSRRPIPTGAPVAPVTHADVVYIWEDRSSPQYLREILRYLQEVPSFQRPLRDETTYGNEKLLKYSMRSVRKNAPWVRRIHVVVPSGQRPKWLSSTCHDGHCPIDVYVWEHEQVFPEALTNSSLPNFNKHAIECYLDRIPGLAEHFVYMHNGDFFGAPVPLNDMFTNHGRPQPLPIEQWGMGEMSGVVNLAASVDAKLMTRLEHGEWRPVKLQQQPRALTRHMFQRMRETFGASVLATASHRFMTRYDVSPVLLAMWLGLEDKYAQKWHVYLGHDMPTHRLIDSSAPCDSLKQLLSTQRSKPSQMIRIGGDSSGELSRCMAAWLEQSFPSNAEWEKQNEAE
jgi:hypothetical protein